MHTYTAAVRTVTGGGAGASPSLVYGRSATWQQRKRARGLCAQCGAQPVPMNPRTGWPAWRCRACARWKSRRREGRHG